MAFYLKANKTKMVNLIRLKGYKPTLRRSHYEKAFRARTYWLSWMENDCLYKASLMTAGGRTYLRVINQTTNAEKMFHIPIEELRKHEMLEEVA